MKLKPEQLKEQLQAAQAATPPKALAPVYLVSGDEPLLVNEVIDALRAAASRCGCEERESHVVERGFSWESVSVAQ